MAMDQPGLSAYSPVGWLVAQPLIPLGESVLEVMRMTVWWSHGVVAITLVAAIPYSKAGHMVTSFVSLVVRDPAAGKRLRAGPAGAQG